MVGTFVGGYRCAISWCDLDLTFDFAYLMLFYVSTGISLMSLISFYLNLGCYTFGCVLM